MRSNPIRGCITRNATSIISPTKILSGGNPKYAKLRPIAKYPSTRAAVARPHQSMGRRRAHATVCGDSITGEKPAMSAIRPFPIRDVAFHDRTLALYRLLNRLPALQRDPVVHYL